MIFCIRCGAQLPDNALFCGRCGHKVGDTVDTDISSKQKYFDEGSTDLFNQGPEEEIYKGRTPEPDVLKSDQSKSGSNYRSRTYDLNDDEFDFDIDDDDSLDDMFTRPEAMDEDREDDELDAAEYLSDDEYDEFYDDEEDTSGNKKVAAIVVSVVAIIVVITLIVFGKELLPMMRKTRFLPVISMPPMRRHLRRN